MRRPAIRRQPVWPRRLAGRRARSAGCRTIQFCLWSHPSFSLSDHAESPRSLRGHGAQSWVCLLQQRVGALPQWMPSTATRDGRRRPPIVPGRTLTSIHRMTIPPPCDSTVTRCRACCPAAGPTTATKTEVIHTYNEPSSHGRRYHLLGAMSILLYYCSSETYQGLRLARMPTLPLTRQPMMTAAGRFAGKLSGRPTWGMSPYCPALRSGAVRFQDLDSGQAPTPGPR